jgi:hypothetical protein
MKHAYILIKTRKAISEFAYIESKYNATVETLNNGMIKINCLAQDSMRIKNDVITNTLKIV